MLSRKSRRSTPPPVPRRNSSSKPPANKADGTAGCRVYACVDMFRPIRKTCLRERKHGTCTPSMGARRACKADEFSPHGVATVSVVLERSHPVGPVLRLDEAGAGPHV